MRHTAYGDAYAHNAQEVIQLLIQESGCHPEDVSHLGVGKNVSGRGKTFWVALVEESSGEYVLHVEADSKEEIEEILHDAGVKPGTEEQED